MARALYGALLLACASPVAAQTLPAPTAQDRIKADVTFLADDLLGGRANGTKGYDIAAAYLASRFQSLGLQPANNGSFLQLIPFARSIIRPGSQSFIAFNAERFDNGVDVAMTGTPFVADQKIDAEMVFVGFGLDAPEWGFDDYAGLDVRGKVVVAMWGFPVGSPSEMAAHLNSDKARMAQERGAIGMLTLSTPTYEKMQPWDMQVKRKDRPSFTWIGPDGRPHSPAPNIQLTGNLGAKAAAALFAGAPRSFEWLVTQSRKPNARLKGFALKPRLTAERHTDITTVKSPNVVALLPGSDPSVANEVIALTGHLDAIGEVTPVNGDGIVNGAMDNASGIATMLEVARTYATSGQRPRRPILFAGLAAEENGLLGASYLANNPVLGTARAVGLVNLDMPMLTYDFTDVVAFGAEHSTIGNAVAKAIASEGIKLTPDPSPDQVLFVRTDHYQFVKKGVPAVSLDTGPGGGGAEVNEAFLATRYHKPGDDISQPFDWNAAAKFARLNYLVSSELANAPEPPRWYEKDFFGETFAKGEPKAKR